MLRLKLLKIACVPVWECYVPMTKYNIMIKIEIVTWLLQRGCKRITQERSSMRKEEMRYISNRVSIGLFIEVDWLYKSSRTINTQDNYSYILLFSACVLASAPNE